MAPLDYTKLVVGQQVAVGKMSRYNSYVWQGVYVVTKVDKMKVVLARVADGYERSFSVKTGVELNSTATRYTTNSLFSVDDSKANEASKQAAAVQNGMWSDLKEAATRKDLFAVQTMLAKLEAVL